MTKPQSELLLEAITKFSEAFALFAAAGGMAPPNEPPKVATGDSADDDG